MKYRYLGKTGLLVSRLCLGTMSFGAEDWGCDRSAALKLITRYLDAGGNFIDTADIYAGGASEQIVGEALKSSRREAVVLLTKCFFRTGSGPLDKGLSRKHILASCEASLKRLGTEYIDIYMIHGADPFTACDETMRALDDLIHQGKVRYLGCSNLFAWQILKANGISALHNLTPLSCGQYLYNLIDRDAEREVLPACADQGMGFLCWSPLGGGLLTGKYGGAQTPAQGTRAHYRLKIDGVRFWHARGFEVAAKLQDISTRRSLSPARLAIAWPLHDRRVTSVIIGVKNTAQLEENMVPGDWDLPPEILSELDQATAPDLGHLAQFERHAYASAFGDEEFRP